MNTHSTSFIYADTYVDYPEAIEKMERIVADIRADVTSETVWFLEHPSIYTAGTSALEKDLLSPNKFPIYQTGRGGQYTYHGPGQLISYVMMDIQQRQIGIREYIKILENIIINVLKSLGLKGEIKEGRVGVWLCDPHKNTEEKIAAIGVRVRRGVTYHGLSLNIDPDLSAFLGIVPCGLDQYGVTSLKKEGIITSRSAIEALFTQEFNIFFK